MYPSTEHGLSPSTALPERLFTLALHADPKASPSSELDGRRDRSRAAEIPRKNGLSREIQLSPAPWLFGALPTADTDALAPKRQCIESGPGPSPAWVASYFEGGASTYLV